VLASVLEVAIGIETRARGCKEHHLAGVGVGSGSANRLLKIGLAGDRNLSCLRVSITVAS
jgi:hypothetical protein